MSWMPKTTELLERILYENALSAEALKLKSHANPNRASGKLQGGLLTDIPKILIAWPDLNLHPRLPYILHIRNHRLYRYIQLPRATESQSTIAAMADQLQELMDIPKDFARDGTLFLNKCTKPDKREFLQISKAVGVGFLIMGTVGFLVKLIHIPVNQILVG